jgi:hypothetical protein
VDDAEYFSLEFCIATEEVILSTVDKIIEIKKIVPKNMPSIFFIFKPLIYPILEPAVEESEA